MQKPPGGYGGFCLWGDWDVVWSPLICGWYGIYAPKITSALLIS